MKSKNEQNTINPSQIKNNITKEVNKKQPVSFKTKQSPRKLVKSPRKPIQHTKIKEKSLKEPKKEEKVTKLVKTTERKSLNEPETKENTVIPSVGNESKEKRNKTQRKSLKTCESPVKPLNLPVKQFSVVVTERNSLNNVETRQLRNKKPQNYIEDSINCTNSSKTSQTPVKRNKVPVYKKLPKNDEPKKAKKDPYEFDVPIEKRNLNDSSKYDKKMHEIMQNIIRKVEKQKKTVKRKKTDVKLKRKEKNIQLTKDVDKESDQIEQILPDPIQTPKVPNKIVMLNDCKLDKPMDTPKNFKNPNANSTFVENVSSPWRFPSEMIIYNPHFIKLKDTALPSINQEPIIDYKLEEARKSHKTPPERQNVRKSPVQKSILNYLKVSGNFEPTINRNLSCSLFDADQLSPIKARPSVEMKQTVKRNILNESNKQNVENRTSLFGFEQSDVDNGENKENSSSSPIRRPFRYEMKQYKKKTVEKPVPVEREIEKNVPDDVVEEESVENESIELFEDPENMFKQTEVNVERKRRRPRYLSTNSDVEEAPRKRKKDVFTKDEVVEIHFKKSLNFNGFVCNRRKLLTNGWTNLIQCAKKLINTFWKLSRNGKFAIYRFYDFFYILTNFVQISFPFYL